MSGKSFTGSYCLLVILLCCGIVPGIIYYFVAQKEIGYSKQTIQQTVVVQTGQPEMKNSKKYCQNCGTEIKKEVDFCEKCGTKIKS